jgi:hypothetical protein
MGWACMELNSSTAFCLENMMGREHIGDIVINGKICTGLKWLKFFSVVDFL